jgi:hypothetical protein
VAVFFALPPDTLNKIQIYSYRPLIAISGDEHINASYNFRKIEKYPVNTPIPS